jgi:hypothetical protein
MADLRDLQKYNADYSADFDARTLVDKEYVDGLSTAPGGNNFSIQFNDNSAFGWVDHLIFDSVNNILIGWYSNHIIQTDNYVLWDDNKITWSHNVVLGSQNNMYASEQIMSVEDQWPPIIVRIWWDRTQWFANWRWLLGVNYWASFENITITNFEYLAGPNRTEITFTTDYASPITTADQIVRNGSDAWHDNFFFTYRGQMNNDWGECKWNAILWWTNNIIPGTRQGTVILWWVGIQASIEKNNLTYTTGLVLAGTPETNTQDISLLTNFLVRNTVNWEIQYRPVAEFILVPEQDPVYIPQLRLFDNSSNVLTWWKWIRYSWTSYNWDGDDEFTAYEPRIYLFKKRRFRKATRRGTSAYAVKKPRGFCMSVNAHNYAGWYMDQLWRTVAWTLDESARCTLNDFNTVWAWNNLGWEHKSLLLSQTELAQRFHPHTLPYDPINNYWAVSTPTGWNKRSKAQYFKFAIMIKKDGKYILWPMSETIRVNYIANSDGQSQSICINTV